MSFAPACGNYLIYLCGSAGWRGNWGHLLHLRLEFTRNYVISSLTVCEVATADNKTIAERYTGLFITVLIFDSAVKVYP